jgi:hypothetical protein
MKALYGSATISAHPCDPLMEKCPGKDYYAAWKKIGYTGQMFSLLLCYQDRKEDRLEKKA